MKLLSAIVPCFNEQENIFDFYDEFMKKTYQWALDPVNNMAFRTACLIYVYMNRTTNDR